MRVGMGYDVHRLTEGRKLILGGVEIPYEKGLLGHSDADVLIHAVMDALLGAAALGDIGKHFPDTDEKYRGISSVVLLKHVAALLEEECFVIENIDATVIAQRPKLLPYMEQMRSNIADALPRPDLSPSRSPPGWSPVLSRAGLQQCFPESPSPSFYSACSCAPGRAPSFRSLCSKMWSPSSRPSRVPLLFSA